MSDMRHDDEPARSWCNVGEYRACIERATGLLRFSVHGKPDISQGFAQPVVLARGWIRDEETVVYWPGSQQLTDALEHELLAAARRMTMRVVGDC